MREHQRWLCIGHQQHKGSQEDLGLPGGEPSKQRFKSLVIDGEQAQQFSKAREKWQKLVALVPYVPAGMERTDDDNLGSHQYFYPRIVVFSCIVEYCQNNYYIKSRNLIIGERIIVLRASLISSVWHASLDALQLTYKTSLMNFKYRWSISVNKVKSRFTLLF